VGGLKVGCLSNLILYLKLYFCGQGLLLLFINSLGHIFSFENKIEVYSIKVVIEVGKNFIISLIILSIIRQ